MLIEGETGVGKELVARIIQGMGDRAGKPFVTVNCGAIPANLVESTLFGHKKGAFTGATADHTGKFAEAHGGTLFLDEVGELPLDTQVKLLRAHPAGRDRAGRRRKVERVNVRVISATNRRLLNLAKDGDFREDLYYRLNVFPIYVPPLRERTRRHRRRSSAISSPALPPKPASASSASPPRRSTLLSGYNWPGNIRQLENAVYRAIVLSDAAYPRNRRLPADRRPDRRPRRRPELTEAVAGARQPRFISTMLRLAAS